MESSVGVLGLRRLLGFRFVEGSGFEALEFGARGA